MAHLVFAEREDANVHGAALKLRDRLHSAPENMLTTPIHAKRFHTPLQSGRKALTTVNNIASTPAAARREVKAQKPQGAKIKSLPQCKEEEYQAIERFISYDPLEFEKDFIPEDLVRLGCLALPGLTRFPPAQRLPEEDFEPFMPQSPVKLPCSDYGAAELGAFLQTINELTVDFPPESD